MNSCADTIVTMGEDDAALHSCADTLAESDDEVDFGDSPTPPIGSGEMKWQFIFLHDIFLLLSREWFFKIFIFDVCSWYLKSNSFLIVVKATFHVLNDFCMKIKLPNTRNISNTLYKGMKIRETL